MTNELHYHNQNNVFARTHSGDCEVVSGRFDKAGRPDSALRCCRDGETCLKHIYDKTFKYVPSGSTNLNATFERVRREREQEAKDKAEKVTTIKPKVRGKTNV
jgi:hypothetical protein